MLGAGLAGSALAWQAHRKGWEVALIDRQDAQSSSRVAAGLVTPITGSRGASSWRWKEFFPAAFEFYQQIECTTKRSFWHVAPALHIYKSEAERDLYRKRWITDVCRQQAEKITVVELETHQGKYQGIQAPFGLCEFQPAARIDTLEYIGATQEYFDEHKAFFSNNIQCDQDIVVESSEAVLVPSLNLRGKRIAFCQGYAARENSYFSELPLHPARGDILTIENSDVACQQIVHGNAWLVPVGYQRFLVGATYDRFALHDHVDSDNEDAVRFRTELAARWESMVDEPTSRRSYRIVEQRSAVRPASYDRHPLIGVHDKHPNVYCLNGMGSKGTLMAPGLADMLIGAMQQQPIESSLVWSRRK